MVIMEGGMDQRKGCGLSVGVATMWNLGCGCDLGGHYTDR